MGRSTSAPNSADQWKRSDNEISSGLVRVDDEDDMSIRPSTAPTLEERLNVAEEINDRRRRPRLLSRTTGWVFLGDDDHAPAREILVADVSRLGVGFVSETQIE